MDSCVAYVLLFVPHLSFSWCLGKVVLRDCGVSWASVMFLTIQSQVLTNLHSDIIGISQ